MDVIEKATAEIIGHRIVHSERTGEALHRELALLAEAPEGGNAVAVVHIPLGDTLNVPEFAGETSNPYTVSFQAIVRGLTGRKEMFIGQEATITVHEGKDLARPIGTAQTTSAATFRAPQA